MKLREGWQYTDIPLRGVFKARAAMQRHSAGAPHARCTKAWGQCGCLCAVCWDHKGKQAAKR